MYTLPQDADGNTVQLSPAKKSERVTNFEDLSNVQSLQILRSASFIEVHAKNGDVAVAYGLGKEATPVTTVDFDDLASPTTIRQYSLTDDLKNANFLSFIAIDEGASVIIIEK